MKIFWVLCSVLVVVFGGNNNGGYSSMFNGNNGYSNSNGMSGMPGISQYPNPGNGNEQEGPKTFRHIYVHAAPEEQEMMESKIIRVPGGGNKHINIIFVKAPSQTNKQQTEVILPEPDQHKSLVYVLMQKKESADDIRVRGPKPTQPTKPEVYFIRYKNQEQNQGSNGNEGVQGGYPGQSMMSMNDFGNSGQGNMPSSAYGAPY